MLPSDCTARCGAAGTDCKQSRKTSAVIIFRKKTSAVVTLTDAMHVCKKSCSVRSCFSTSVALRSPTAPTLWAATAPPRSSSTGTPKGRAFQLSACFWWVLKVVLQLHFFIFVPYEIPCYAEQAVLPERERERDMSGKKEYSPTAVAARG